MKQRDIVLVPFPFSDQSGEKIRPALIISNDHFNRTSDDVIVCAVTSNFKFLEYSVILNQADIENGILYERSAVKIENIFKMQKSLIIKTIATIKKTAFLKVITSISSLIRSE